MDTGVKPNFTKDNLPDWFCPVPFANLIFNPWGNVGACREQGNDNHVGDAREQSWQEIWNGEKIRAWRREFLTGNIKTCADHIRHRKCNKEAFSQKLIEYIELSEIQTTPPKRISPDFNGHCNLQCGMCTIWKQPNGLYDKLNFWEDAEKNLFPYLKQVDPLAGEPFIQKDTFRLMDIMGRVNPQAVWRITTNGHWKFTQFIKDKLNKIVVSTINVSLDAVTQETYRKIRKNGDIEVVLKTIDDLVEYRQERMSKGDVSFNMNINMTVQTQNWREMGAFVRLALVKNSIPLVLMLYRPAEFSLLKLPLEERQEIVDFYFDTIEWGILKYCRRAVVPLLESLPPSEARDSRIQKFSKYGTCAKPLEEADHADLREISI
ncbi:MAG: SPASM domain-containing protein [Bdellovibrionia bacterium]